MRKSGSRPYRRRTPDQQIEDMQARIAELRREIEARERFSPAKVRQERRRLELSAADYGELVGVTGLTIYNWEKGRSRPRPEQIDAWLRALGIGKRAAWKRLGYA